MTDPDSEEVPGAKVVLTMKSWGVTFTTTSGPDGVFSFVAVPAGEFTLAVTAPNFASGKAAGVLQPGQQLIIDPIAMPIVVSAVDVEVDVSRQDLAEAEIKVEEHQRIGGVLPNFYVAYDWHAASLTARQKFELADRTVIDPVSFLLIGVFAGVEQANNSFSGYGPGAAGYGKRYAAGYGDFLTGTYLGGAILPSLLHQDPRYFYLGRGTVLHRTLHALASAVICRGDNGKWQPNYSSVLGDLASGAISNAYYPASNRNGASLTIENGLLDIVSDAVGNVVQELVFKHITPHAPNYAP